MYSPSGNEALLDETLEAHLVRRLTLGIASGFLAFRAIIEAERRRAKRTKRVQIPADAPSSTIVQSAETATRQTIGGRGSDRVLVGSRFRQGQRGLRAGRRAGRAVVVGSVGAY